MRKPKITVIGAGDVGAATAQRLAEGRLGKIVLVDVGDGVLQGKALDSGEAAPAVARGGAIVGAADFDATKGSDIIVMTAGLAGEPGMSRDDLQDANAGVVGDCVSRAVRKSRDSIIIMVTNPLDVMCEAARRVSGFPRERVIGMAGVLHTALTRAFIAAELGASSEIVNLLETGSAYDAPAAGVYELVDAIVNDRKKILPCSVYLQGEFGVTGVFVGVPARIGAAGVEHVIELKLTDEETALLHTSAADVAAQSARLPAGLGKA